MKTWKPSWGWKILVSSLDGNRGRRETVAVWYKQNSVLRIMSPLFANCLSSFYFFINSHVPSLICSTNICYILCAKHSFAWPYPRHLTFKMYSFSFLKIKLSFRVVLDSQKNCQRYRDFFYKSPAQPHNLSHYVDPPLEWDICYSWWTYAVTSLSPEIHSLRFTLMLYTWWVWKIL